MVARTGYGQTVGAVAVAFGVGLLSELGGAEHMPSRGALDDDGQMDDHGLVADVGDMPVVRVLDMAQHYGAWVKIARLSLCRAQGQGQQKEQGHA